MKFFSKEIKEKITLTETLSISVRKYLSTRHMYAAALFTRQCGDIEKTYDGDFTEEVYFTSISYAISTVFESVSFLEASINEFFADSLENPQEGLVKDLDDRTIQVLASLWKNNIVKTTSILDKYNLILNVADKNAFQKGKDPYQSVDSLIKLRNSLVHYKPEWIGESPHEIEKILKYKFPINRIMKSPGNPFYPDQCLGFGCAEWSVKSSLRFVEEFYNKLGYTYPFTNMKSRYKTR